MPFIHLPPTYHTIQQKNNKFFKIRLNVHECHFIQRTSEKKIFVGRFFHIPCRNKNWKIKKKLKHLFNNSVLHWMCSNENKVEPCVEFCDWWNDTKLKSRFISKIYYTRMYFFYWRLKFYWNFSFFCGETLRGALILCQFLYESTSRM